MGNCMIFNRQRMDAENYMTFVYNCRLADDEDAQTENQR